MKAQIKELLGKCPFTNKLLEKRASRRGKKSFEKQKEVFAEKAGAVVSNVETFLNTSGLVCFATCGTLLGLIRENRLLKNDYDLDYALLVKKASDWSTLETVLESNGYKKIREFSMNGKITEESFMSPEKVIIDFFGHFLEGDKLHFYIYDKFSEIVYPSADDWSVCEVYVGQFVGTEKRETEIGIVTVPKNYEEYLSYNYDDNWRIPDPNFQTDKGKGSRLLDGIFGRYKSYS